MSEAKTGQVNKNAAEIYEDFFIPALFDEWTARVCDRAGIEKGQKILDVACGTGILTREVFRRIGSEGSVIGSDINDGMLNVAGQKNSEIEWKNSPAEKLPFADNSFDRVVSQFGLMFFAEKSTAIKEMFRVLKGKGLMTIVVWGSLEDATGYLELHHLLIKLFGKETAEAVRAPYSMGNPEKLKSLFAEAGIKNPRIELVPGKAKFPSIKDWMFTEIKGWTLADKINEEQFQLLQEEAETVLEKFVSDESGKVEFDHPAYIITVEKP